MFEFYTYLVSAKSIQLWRHQPLILEIFLGADLSVEQAIQLGLLSLEIAALRVVQLLRRVNLAVHFVESVLGVAHGPLQL